MNISTLITSWCAGLPLADSTTTQVGASENPGMGAPGLIQLFPLGSFSARDGRPKTMQNVKARAWHLDRVGAEVLVQLCAERQTPIVVDYEHQTHLSGENGQPAPAAGWIHSLFIQGNGLFAKVDWTDKARAHITAREYRYISPTFRFDKESGAVLELLSAALTNYPALDGMAAVQAKQGELMNLTMLKKLLALPDDADEARCQDALQALLTQKDAEIASLKEQVKKPDPALFAPVALLTETQAKLTAVLARVTELENTATASTLDTAIEDALKDGRLHSAGKEWAQALARTHPEALSSFLASAPGIAALRNRQSDILGAPSESPTLSQEDAYVCAQLGLKSEDFIKAKKEFA